MNHPQFSSKLLILILCLCVVLGSAQAQVVRSFTSRYNPVAGQTGVNANGNIKLIGNVLMTCTGTSGGVSCATAQSSSSYANNNYASVFVNADTGAGLTNSSSATLSLPTGSTVLFAGLYWGGRAGQTDTNRGRIKFKAPGATSYTQISGASVDTINATTSTANAYPYAAFYDVTSTVQSAGNGTYWAGDITATNCATGDGLGCYAGWSLVVMYSNSSEAFRNLVVFDGLALINTTATSTTVSGFLTPAVGTFSTYIGAVAWEGDGAFTGDQFQLNGTAVGDAANPTTDFFNGTVSELGSQITTKTPNYVNQMGLDIDRIDATGKLANGATTATLNFTTSGDVYFPQVMTFATDLYVPDLTSSFTKTVTDINGGLVQPGDVLEYTITDTNSGNDGGTNVVLTDPIPVNTTYVAGSLNITAGANSGAKTDASGDDQAEYDSANNRVRFRLGTGANATTGGLMLPTQSTTIKFRVTVNTSSYGATISNTAGLTYNSQTLGTAYSKTASAAANSTVTQSDLSITKTHTGNFTRGSSGSYTLTVSNTAGGSATTGTVSVTDTLPTGLTATAISGTGWSCTLATLICTRSDALAAGSSYPPITLTVNVAQTAASSLTNSATVAVASDANSANNTATDPTTIVSIGDLSISKTNGVTAVTGGSNTSYTIRVTNAGPSTLTGAILTDAAATGLTKTSVACSAIPGQCVTSPSVAQLEAGTFALPALASGQFYEITVIASVTANSGTVINTATIAAPSGTTDSNTANNTISDTDTVNPGPDLTISKTHSGNFDYNSTGSYSIVVSNAVGAASTSGTVTVTDTLRTSTASATLPTGISILSMSGTGWTCTPASGTCTRSDALAAGASYPAITVVVSLATNAAATFTNRAVVSGGSEPAVNNTNNTIDDNTTVVFPDLAIVKDHAGNFPKGGTGTFNITVSNASGAPATSGTVTVTDTLPTGLSYTGITPFTVNGWSCTYTSATRLFTCTRSDSLVGGSSYPPLALTIAVGSSAASSTNTATVSGGGDQSTGNNSSSDAYTTFTVVNNVDLSITKLLTSGVPVPGTSITYTLTVTNSASSAYATALTAISVVDLLPTALTGVTYTPSSGSYNSTTGDWTGISLARGASITMTVSGTIARSALGSLVNTATVAPSGTSISDSNNTNNSATDTRVLIPTVNLNISKTDNLTTVVPGNPITYTIVVTNSGSSDLQSATLSDVIDTSKLQSITWTCTAAGGATCTPSGSGNISNTIDLPSTSTNAAASLTYTVNATVISSATGILSNTVSVTLPSGTTNTSGSLSAADTTAIQPTVNLTVSKSDAVASVVPGNAVTYTITISNTNTVVVGGNTFNTNDLTGATVSDVIDTNLYQGISWTCAASVGSSCAASGSGSISDTVTLLRGGTLTYTINATVKPSATGSLANTVNLTMPSGVTNAGSSSATDTDTLTPTVNLSISKTDSKTTILPGNTQQYTITVSNAGPSNLTGATLTDNLPSALTGVGWTCATSGGATCTASGSGNISQTVNIPVGGSLSYTVNAAVSSSANGTLSNTATVSMPVGTTNTGASSATDNTDILTLTATKSVSSSTPVLPGTTLTYTLTITNTSLVAITGATFTDALPTGTSYYPGSATLNGSAISGSYPFASAYSINSSSAASGTLAAGASATIVYKLIVVSTAPPSSVSNQGTVNFTGGPSSGILTDDPSTAPAADPTVSAVTTPSTFFLNYENGSDGGYNCVVTSDMGVGGLDVSGAVFGRSQVNAPINGLLHLVSGQLDSAAQNASLESPWMRFGVSGYSNSVSFRHKINNLSTTNARIVVSVVEAGTGVETTLYTYTYVAGDVGVTKSASLTVSQTGVYKVRIRFLGTSGSGTSRIALDDWIIAAPQATVATGTLAAPISGASCNYIVDPTIVKTGPATAAQFTVVTYTLTITNNGPAAFQGSITDVMPANFTSVTWGCLASGDADCDSGASGTGSSGSGNSISLANVRIRPGSGNSVVITVTATATTAGLITNTALVVLPSGATDNVNTADNSSSVNTLINLAGVTVSGYIYHDLQPNFLRDPAENWATGATLRVNLVQGGTVVKTTTVNAGTGTYSFSTVLSGSYTIIVTNTATAITAVAPTGWLFITPGTGSLSVTVGTSDLIEQNFGLFNGSKVLGTVFRDDGYSSATANDALQNGGELGISNVAVTASDGTTALSTLTNTGGAFSFYIPASFGSTLTLSHTQNPATGTNIAGASAVLATSFNSAAARSRSISSFSAGQTYAGYNFGVVYASSFRLDQSGQTTSPGAISYSHRFRPGTLGDVVLSLGSGSFSYLVRRDANCNNTFESSEIYQPLSLGFSVDSSWPRDPDGRLSECTLEVLVSVPSGRPSGMVDIAQLQAELQWNRPVVSPIIKDSRTVIDTTTLLLPGNLRLDKQVRNVTQGGSFSVGAQGKPGEVLEYCIAYSNIGAQPISGVVMTDPIPFFTQYQSNSMLWNSSSLSDSTDSDAGELVSSAFIQVRIGNLSSGQSGQVCYRVSVR